MLCGYLDFYQRLSLENEKAGRLFVRANSRCPTIYVCSISLLRGFGSCRKAKRPFLHPRFGIFRIQPFEIQKTAWLRGFLPKYLFGFPMMGRPYKKDACGLFILKKASIYAALRPIEKL